MLSGRLTLTSGSPVLTSTVSGAGTIYFSPYNGNRTLLYNGSSYDDTVFAELSQATTDTTKSPAAAAADKNYDMFVWSDSGTIRCTRGPAWSSDTARGTGAGTTELERVKGIMLNKVSITNGPAANRGTYVGSVRANGSALVDWIFGATDTTSYLGIWNEFNRLEVASTVTDSVNSFTTTNGRRSWNNSNVTRINFISGLSEEMFAAWGRGCLITTGFINAGLGIGFNSTSAISGSLCTFSGTAGLGASHSKCVTRALGWNYFQALEVTGGAVTAYGDNGTPLFMQSGITYAGRM
jgi:hypothetical protein